jgi:hypothetical protein
MLYDYTYVTLWKRQNYEYTEKVSVCKGWTEGRMSRQDQDNLRATKPCHKVCVFIYLSKLTERTTPRMNPKTNYGLWVLER